MPTAHDWSLRPLPHAQTPVGPCAWRASLLTDHYDYLAGHPSLLVTHPDDSLDLLAQMSSHAGSFPLMLCIREPQFSRRIPDLITQRLDALKLKSVEFVTLFVDDPVDLKGGSAFQYLFHFREKGILKHLALAHPDIRWVEWMAMHTPATAYLFSYELSDLSARHATIPAIIDNGGVPIALPSSWFVSNQSMQADPQSVRFALGDTSTALSVLDSPIPPGLQAMSPEEVETTWNTFSQSRVFPAPLGRGLPSGEGSGDGSGGAPDEFYR